MKKYSFLLVFLVELFPINLIYAANHEIDSVKKKLYELALKRYYRDEDYTTKKINEIRELFDGEKWADIDYSNTDDNTWKPIEHWKRLYEMAIAFSDPESNLYQNRELSTKIILGIRFWFKADPTFQSSNYWWNAIGAPLAMGKVFILMEKYLSESDFQKAIHIMNLGIKPDFYDYHGKASGQNLLWLAYVHIYTSCFANDLAGLKRAFSESAKEIRISDAEGIQPDYSFHQHGPQFYSLGYGRTFTLTASHLAYLANNTSYAFSLEKVDILSRYILDGQQWITKNKFMEYTAMGREITRGFVDRNSILFGLKLLSSIVKAHKQEFDEFYNQLLTGVRSKFLVGNKYFSRVDFMVQQRNSYYFSVKAASNRIIGSESGNGENLKGYYQGQGTYYLVRSGNEYNGIFPVWNWRQLPGSLCTQSNNPLPSIDWGKNTTGLTSFVYGLSDGLYGCFVYDYKKDEVRAKRSWFFFDKEIVCMVSGADNKSENNLHQNINQAILHGDVFVDGVKQTSRNKIYNKVNKVFHDSVGYILNCYSYETAVKQEMQKGTWKSVNISGSADTVALPVFSLYMNLGKQVKNGSFYYIVLPGISRTYFDKYRLKDNLSFLHNDTLIQAVYHSSLNQLQAVFYQAGKLKLPWKGLTLDFLKPGLIIMKIHQEEIIIDYAQPSDKKQIVVDLHSKVKFKNNDMKIY